MLGAGQVGQGCSTYQQVCVLVLEGADRAELGQTLAPWLVWEPKWSAGHAGLG